MELNHRSITVEDPLGEADTENLETETLAGHKVPFGA